VCEVNHITAEPKYGEKCGVVGGDDVFLMRVLNSLLSLVLVPDRWVEQFQPVCDISKCI
jgi:hypothetical protein